MQCELILLDKQVWTTPILHGRGSGPGTIDSGHDKTLSAKLQEQAIQAGGRVNAHTESHSETQSTGLNPDPTGRRGPLYYPQDISTLVEFTTYTFATAAALAVFLRNVVGTIKDWRDLGAQARHHRYFTLKIGSRAIQVNDGDDLVEVLERHLAEGG